MIDENKCCCELRDLSVVESKHPDGQWGWQILAFKGGYIVESVSRAMWHVTRDLHDKYGRQYDYGCYQFDQDLIRPEEVFPDIESARQYIKDGYKTTKQLAKAAKKKQEKLAKQEQEERELLSQLKKKYPD